MQITIELEKDKIILPLANNQEVQGLIYHAIGTDSDYSEKVHEKGHLFEGRKFKLFTFGELKGKYEICDKNIIYSSRVTLEIRSPDVYFIQLLLSYFSINSEVQLGNNAVKVEKVRLSDEHVFNDCIEIKTLSPITVYSTEDDGHTTYFSPNDQQFYSAIAENARKKWISCYGNDEEFDMQIFPTENDKYIKRATHFKTTFITAWHGSFILKGSPRVLDFLFQTGLGSKNSQGFGMFNIIN